MSTHPEPVFIPGELAAIAHASEPHLIGQQVQILDIRYQTWPCGADFFWTGWGCRIGVISTTGTEWWSEMSLKKLPGAQPGQWIEAFKPSLLGVSA